MVKVESRLVMKMHAMCCCPSMAATASHCQALPHRAQSLVKKLHQRQHQRISGSSDLGARCRLSNSSSATSFQRLGLASAEMLKLNFRFRNFWSKTAGRTPTTTPSPQAKQESPFLTRLPPEIRVLIYKLVFARDTIHLLHNKGRISHLRIPLRSGPAPHEREGDYYYIYAPFSVERPHISSLLLTCRQIHKEAAPLFYSAPVFRVSLQETWNVFAKLIGPENLAHVRSLRAPVHLQQAQNSSPPALASGIISNSNNTSSRGRGRGRGRGRRRGVAQPNAPAASMLRGPPGSSCRDEERKVYDEFYDILATQMHGLRDLMLVLVSLPQGQVRSLQAEWHGPLRRLRGLSKFSLEIRNDVDAEAEDTAALVMFLRETFAFTVRGFQLGFQLSFVAMWVHG
ncbi:predicted protein [Histoplasma mississippiense (nom. inval.)]|uniref:predicted protein n=1 Tax=Ajellomyces capsulatus (strain NAm1 / WU24) TaxID=2059318 RepID=UPI000157C147|nr:predicted protein [Histoplasma mississippiense (nom. inval.)]EDN07993.1 predicted protein [Histoplasma mississippiense (nom. inval.)]